MKHFKVPTSGNMDVNTRWRQEVKVSMKDELDSMFDTNYRV